jgi:hypothetical protein
MNCARPRAPQRPPRGTGTRSCREPLALGMAGEAIPDSNPPFPPVWMISCRCDAGAPHLQESADPMCWRLSLRRSLIVQAVTRFAEVVCPQRAQLKMFRRAFFATIGGAAVAAGAWAVSASAEVQLRPNIEEAARGFNALSADEIQYPDAPHRQWLS